MASAGTGCTSDLVDAHGFCNRSANPDPPGARRLCGRTPTRVPAVIRDIALIALALAHGADDDLTPQEVEEIAARLQGWRQDAADPTALGALKTALGSYVQAEGETMLETAIERVKTRLSPADRTLLVADLASIALADGVVLDEERDMLQRLCAAWQVPWPLDEQPVPLEAACDDLAHLYLHVACDLDGGLSTAEIELVMHLLERHAGCSESDLFRIVQDVHEARKQQTPDEVEAVLDRLQRSLDAPARAHLLDELRQIIHADGRLHPAEEAFVERVAARWDVAPVA